MGNEANPPPRRSNQQDELPRLRQGPQVPLDRRLQPRPPTVTVRSDWKSVTARDATLEDFTHGFARIGIENQALLLFEADQRHLLRLVKSFSDVLLDSDQLLKRSKDNPLGLEDSVAAEKRSESSVLGSSGALSPPLRGGSKDYFLKIREVERSREKALEKNLSTAALIYAGGGGATDAAVLDAYDAQEVQRMLTGVPSAASVSMRYRLSPWRALLEEWIRALREERRPEGRAQGYARHVHQMLTARSHLAPGVRSLDICWQSVRPQEAATNNISPTVQVALFLQCALRVMDIATLNAAVALQQDILSAHRAAADRHNSIEYVDVATGHPTSSSRNEHGVIAAPVSLKQQSVVVKAQLYQRLVTAPAAVPHLLTTAACVFAIVEHLGDWFGPCAAFVQAVLRQLLPCLYLPDAKRTTSTVFSAMKCGPRAPPAELAIQYVHGTYAHEVTQYAPLLHIALLRTRDKAQLKDKQDRMMAATVKQVMRSFLQSVFLQWRSVTRRHKQLKAAIGNLLVVTSDGEVLRRAVGRWRHHAQRQLAHIQYFRDDEQHASPSSPQPLFPRRGIAGGVVASNPFANQECLSPTGDMNASVTSSQVSPRHLPDAVAQQHHLPYELAYPQRHPLAKAASGTDLLQHLVSSPHRSRPLSRSIMSPLSALGDVNAGGVGFNSSFRSYLPGSAGGGPLGSLPCSPRHSQSHRGAAPSAASQQLNVWDPKTPLEKLRRAQLLANVLQEGLAARNRMVTKFEYTERQELADRIEALDDGIEQYTAMISKIGETYRESLDYLYPFLPSPLQRASSPTGGVHDWRCKRSPQQDGGLSNEEESLKADDVLSSSFRDIADPDFKLQPIDTTPLTVAGHAARLARQQKAKKAASLYQQHAAAADGNVAPARSAPAFEALDLVTGSTASVQPSPTSRRGVQFPRAQPLRQDHSCEDASLASRTSTRRAAVVNERRMTLQEAEDVQIVEMHNRQRRIFVWLMNVAKYDIASRGGRLNTSMQRMCTATSQLSLSVVGRTTHLLPLLRLCLLAIAPPVIPLYGVHALFGAEVTRDASTQPQVVPPSVCTEMPATSVSLLASVDSKPFAQPSAEDASMCREPMEALSEPPPFSQPQRRRSASSMQIGFSPVDGVFAEVQASRLDDRGSETPATGEDAILSMMPELREEMETVQRRRSVAFTLTVGEEEGSPGGNSSKRPSVANTSDLSSAAASGAALMRRRMSSGVSLNAPPTGGAAGAVGGRRKSLTAKLQAITIHAAETDDANSDESFSSRYLRRKSTQQEQQQLSKRKSVDVFQNKSAASIASLEAAALSLVADHRRGFVGGASKESMFEAEDNAALQKLLEERQKKDADADAAANEVDEIVAEDKAELLKLSPEEVLAKLREEEAQINSIGEEAAIEAREKEIHEVLSGVAECCDATSVTHFVLKLVNKLQRRSEDAVDNADDAAGGVSPRGGGGKGRGDAASRFASHKLVSAKSSVSYAAAASHMIAFRVFPHALTRHMVHKQRNWRTVMLAALYYTQVGPTCMAFKNIYAGMETRCRKPVAEMSEEERNDFLLGKRRNVPIYVANSQLTPHDVAPTSAMQMHQLLAKRRQRKRHFKLDVEEANAAVLYDDAVRDVATRAFYGAGTSTTATQVYEQFCEASGDIACASFILPSYMSSKLRTAFGVDSSFWKPVVSMRILTSARDVEDVITTLAPLARIPPQELCDRLLQALDDTDLFFASLSSAEVEDAYTACLPEIAVVFALYSSGDPTAPTVSYDTWKAMNAPLCDQTYTPVMADTIFETIARRLVNYKLQQDAIEATNGGVVQAFQFLQTLVMPSSSSSTPSAATQQGAASSAAAASPLSYVQTTSLDLDSFCDALSMLISMKFPNPFVPLEQKIVPFVQTLLVPLVGAKSKDIRRLMQQQNDPYGSKKGRAAAGPVSMENLSEELQQKIRMIREKQMVSRRKRME